MVGRLLQRNTGIRSAISNLAGVISSEWQSVKRVMTGWGCGRGKWGNDIRVSVAARLCALEKLNLAFLLSPVFNGIKCNTYQTACVIV
jgi:hypothetical protein